MKCMIAFACLLAVASAGYVNSPVVSAYGAYDDGSYKGELYNGALGYNGVYGNVYGGAYAGALGYSTLGSKAVAYNAPIVSAPHPVRVAQTYAAPIVQGYAHGYAAPLAYSGYAKSVVAPIAYSGYAQGYAGLATEARLVDPVAIAAGAPLPTGDTVEVAAAKAVHYQAHAAAKGVAYSGYAKSIVSPIAYSGYAASPIAYSGYGASPIAYSGYSHGVVPVAHGYAGLATEARLVDPVAIAAGAPLPTGDTVEVAAAKAFHHQAHVEAKTGHLLAKSGHFITKRSPGLLATGYAAPLAYSAPSTYGYSSYASPLAYSGYTGYTGYGYGGHLGAYYG